MVKIIILNCEVQELTFAVNNIAADNLDDLHGSAAAEVSVGCMACRQLR